MRSLRDVSKWVLSCFFTISCASQIVVPDRPVKDPEAAWSRVLKRYVNNKGHVDFQNLSKNRTDLEEYVAFIAQVSPETHPQQFTTKDARLAHYINSYNALSMYNVLLRDIPEDNGSFFKRFGFFYNTEFKIGKKYLSLYSYENDVIRTLGDPRVHVALNCMAMSCPRLPQKPFTEKKLQKELEQQAFEFYNENRNVRLDDKNKKVYLSEILDFFTEDFTKVSPSLIAYVNKYRKGKKIPENYEVDFIDYDWTINDQRNASQGIAKK